MFGYANLFGRWRQPAVFLVLCCRQVVVLRSLAEYRRRLLIYQWKLVIYHWKR